MEGWPWNACRWEINTHLMHLIAHLYLRTSYLSWNQTLLVLGIYCPSNKFIRHCSSVFSFPSCQDQALLMAGITCECFLRCLYIGITFCINQRYIQLWHVQVQLTWSGEKGKCQRSTQVFSVLLRWYNRSIVMLSTIQVTKCSPCQLTQWNDVSSIWFPFQVFTNDKIHVRAWTALCKGHCMLSVQNMPQLI